MAEQLNTRITLSDIRRPSSPLGRAVDENLLLQARESWQDSRQRLRDLMATAPSVRASINTLIRQELDVDGEQVHLHFAAQGDAPARDVTLTDAWAYAQQHYAFAGVDPTLDQRCTLTGLSEETTPVALLQRLLKLNLRHGIRSHWITWWIARAPGTPMARRELANQLYRQHFLAAAQHAVAVGEINTDQVAPLLRLVDPPADEQPADGQALYVEQLLLTSASGPTVEVPGALVMTRTDQDNPVTQCVYLPTRQPALMVFGDRVRLETWLRDQPELFPGVAQITREHSIEYRTVETPLQAGLTHLQEHWIKQKQDTLTSAADGDLAEHGASALHTAERIDRLQREPLLAAAPELPAAPDSTENPPPFTGLTADVPLGLRRQALKQQQNALEVFVGEDDSRLALLTPLFDALHQARQQANTAAGALLDQKPALMLSELLQKHPPQYTALLQARWQGLKQEAELLRQLNQISIPEYQWLMDGLDPDKPPAKDIAVACLVLSMIEQKNGEKTISQKELEGVLLITQTSTLKALPSSPNSLLLYWPGHNGGVHRFENFAQLQAWFFVQTSTQPALTLEPRLLSQKAFDYSLHQQLSNGVQQIEVLLHRTSEPEQALQQATELQAIRVKLLHELGVPANEARELAYTQWRERQQTGALAEHLTTWLNNVSVEDRAQLKAWIEDYWRAMRRADHALEQKLPLSHTYCKTQLEKRLNRDFALKQPFSVTLDLPETVAHRQHFFAAPGAPGTPTKTVLEPSTARVSLSLEDLALGNIDNALSERLGFMKVLVSTLDTNEREVLAAALTPRYVKTMVTELDVAQQYEDLIKETWMGTDREASFTRDARLECLMEPHRLILKIQGRLAHLNGTLTADELQVFNQAAEQAKPVGLVVLPAVLSVGGADTDDGPSTLSGISFIEEKSTGLTLLYLPDSPDRQYVRRFDTREHARQALYNLCLSSDMVSYLAARAVPGDVERHAGRINQAVLKNYSALIAIGKPWPGAPSLATHVFNAHMGRLLEAHRATSRSNSELYRERYAMKGEQAFTWIKMAMGVVPIVGTAIGLHDGWTSANEAVRAFRRGDPVEGLQAVTQVLQSLIDAAIDVGTGVLITPNAARARTAARQLRNAFNVSGYLRPPPSRSAHIGLRFSGYEYEKALSLGHLQPATYGLYRHIYRHADGDFILRRHALYQVELQDGHWRLSGNSKKTYKQPIALDETGQWDTHFGVYGTSHPGGLAGGGAALGHLADRLDPLWPLAIRERLPRWWTDQVYRRQYALEASIDQIYHRFDQNHKRVGTLVDRYENGETALLDELVTDLTQGIALAKQLHEQFEQVLPFSRGNRASVGTKAKSDAAYEVVWKSQWLIKLRGERMVTHSDDIEKLTALLEAMPYEQVTVRAALREQIRGKHIANLEHFRHTETAMETMNTWNSRVSLREHRQRINIASEVINRHLSERKRNYTKVAALLDVIDHGKALSDVSWHYLQGALKNAKTTTWRALDLQTDLLEISSNLNQRNTILNFCIDAYENMRMNLDRWSTSYPQHFDAVYVPQLRAELEKMAERARKTLREPAPRKPTTSPRRIFETEDNTLLIGVESWEPSTRVRRYTITGAQGRTEIWEQTANGRYYLTNPEPIAEVVAARSLNALISEAQARLKAVAAYIKKVRDYARQGLLPVEMEEMLAREADELLTRARTIAPLAPDHITLKQLQDGATQLTTTGRALRTEFSLSSKKPTDGMLDDLARHNVVEVRRNSGLKRLPLLREGRPDFMQEYEIWDLTALPPTPLWYAHFHYNRRAATFDQFEKAHLKLPEHRGLTHGDDPTLPFSDIGKKSSALPHIRPLWVAADEVSAS
ncbi:dermonecrotic toxin domain-containing protein [Pseudomonas marginalis]|uniref:dermonecrotic toxin domain-containing protein n=1 Tax=Pseudomonas marginalis TaxID=298 RepID=UPI002033504C|nr:DUF6543 domain-containing protein [Pseudomonas marginalis]MCM2376836.1 hypothetical protein [Pseudomonas marginalis]